MYAYQRRNSSLSKTVQKCWSYTTAILTRCRDFVRSLDDLIGEVFHDEGVSGGMITATWNLAFKSLSVDPFSGKIHLVAHWDALQNLLIYLVLRTH